MNSITKQKVKEYFKRLKEDGLLEKFNYPPEQKGVFQLVQPEERNKYSEEVFLQGTFLDAIAFAVNHENYYGDWLANDVKFVNNCNNGYLKLVNPIILNKKRLKDLENLSK
jgi:hypothetical protein